MWDLYVYYIIGIGGEMKILVVDDELFIVCLLVWLVCFEGFVFMVVYDGL